MRSFSRILLAVLTACAFGCGDEADRDAAPAQKAPVAAVRVEGGATPQSTVGDVLKIKGFENFGRMLFPADRPIDDKMTLTELTRTYTWYDSMDVNQTVDIINSIKLRTDAGEQVYYPLCSEDDAAIDPTCKNTGLFFFKGKKDGKFAVMNAGGGFMYVAALADSFPQALEVSRMGYNTFVLIYRPNFAYNDLARALSYIYDHADEMEVDPYDYSLWGGSSGGRMAATLGREDNISTLSGRADIDPPAAVIIQYADYAIASDDDAPTFACVGKDDRIIAWQTMEKRVKALQMMGIPAEFRSYPGVGHGFALGWGTPAEGWLGEAVAFWEKQIAAKKAKK